MHKKPLWRMAVLFVASIVVLAACGSGCGGGSGSPANPNEPAVNMEFSWTCPSCSEPTGVYITNQTSTGSDTATISGFIMVCSGNGSCPEYCSASADADHENTFSGTVSGNTFSVTNTAIPSGWSASGYVVGASMRATVVSNVNGCYGNTKQTQTFTH